MDPLSIEREYIDALVLGISTTKVRRVLTMPVDNLNLERKIIEKYPEVQLISIQSNTKTLSKLSKEETSKKITLTSQTLRNLINNMDPALGRFEIVYLDFRTWLSSENVKVIRDLIRNKVLSTKGVLAINIILGNESKRHNKLLNIIAKNRFRAPMSLSEAKKHIIPTAIAEELKENLYYPMLKANLVSFRTKSSPSQIMIFKMSSWTEVMADGIDHDPSISGLQPFTK